MATTVTLLCLVHGNSSEHAFPVRIDKTLLVGDLTKEIKKEKENDFHNIDADKLILWKVNIPQINTMAIQKLILKDDKGKGIEKLWSASKISKFFSNQPADEHIHVIVESPARTEGKHYVFCLTRENFLVSSLHSNSGYFLVSAPMTPVSRV
jgi:hypothetical protein